MQPVFVVYHSWVQWSVIDAVSAEWREQRFWLHEEVMLQYWLQWGQLRDRDRNWLVITALFPVCRGQAVVTPRGHTPDDVWHLDQKIAGLHMNTIKLGLKSQLRSTSEMRRRFSLSPVTKFYLNIVCQLIKFYWSGSGSKFNWKSLAFFAFNLVNSRV